VKSGFTPMEAIQAATSIPARVMHREGEVGTIEPGKRADLVLVEGNSAVRIEDLRRRKQVIVGGAIYDPAPLWRLTGLYDAVR
jgi:imidazolonepropionase-like amidohydrolase